MSNPFERQPCGDSIEHVVRIELANEPSDADVEVVNGLLRNFNKKENAEFWRKITDPTHKSQPLHIFVYESGRAIIGGLLGETSLSWLKIRVMAVDEPFRRQGLGTKLSVAAESEAVRRGCKYSFLDTMQYQAPEFYQRLGYKVAGSIPDWDSHGHAKYFMTKKLSGSSA